MKIITQLLLITSGCISLIIGIIGIFVPLLPTTPFLLLTAYCFMKSSPALHEKFMKNKIFGKYISNYTEKKAVPLKIKIVAILSLWISISFSIFYMLSNPWLKLSLFLFASIATYHIIKFRTLKK